MTFITCPLLANQRTAQDTRSLFRKLGKQWKEKLAFLALSICSVQCDIVIKAHADLSIKIRAKVAHVGEVGKGVVSIIWRWYIWLARRLIFILSNAQSFHSHFLAPLLICLGLHAFLATSPILPDAPLCTCFEMSSGDSTEREHRDCSLQKWISLLWAAQNKESQEISERVYKLVLNNYTLLVKVIQQPPGHIITQQVFFLFFFQGGENRFMSIYSCLRLTVHIVHNFEIKLRENTDGVFGIKRVDGAKMGLYTWPCLQRETNKNEHL